MKEKLFKYLSIYINKNIIFHLIIYFFLVFFVPFFSKVIWLLTAQDGLQGISKEGLQAIFFDPMFVLILLFTSLTVLFSDVFQILIWLLLNKLQKFPMKNVVLIYIYNKLLLPVAIIAVLINVNTSLSVINFMFMTVFTIIFFNWFKYKKKINRLLPIILILVLAIMSYQPVYRVLS